MSSTVYDLLADAMDRLPNGFPRTPTNVESRILERIFSPEEATIAALLTIFPETAEKIALTAGLSIDKTANILDSLAGRSLVWTARDGGENRYRLAPFIVGIYEAQVRTIDRDFAELFEEYIRQGGIGIMAPLPAISRVVPVHRAVKSDLIQRYESVRQILLDAGAVRVVECICRKKEGLRGNRCRYPLEVCFQVFPDTNAPRDSVISRDEALEILDETERVGLVHTTSNVMNGITYICNCCGCCCGMLQSIKVAGLAHSVASSNYLANVDRDRCIGCGVCADRCQIQAISVRSGFATVDRSRCIGCGLCATGCPEKAATLTRKPEAEIVLPPVTFGEWERLRLENRGFLP